MEKNQIDKIEKLIRNNNIQQAEIELAKFGPGFFKNTEYLYLRSKIFFTNKLYYIAIDTLLIALEFEENDKVYNLLSTIYATLGNNNLSKKIGNPDQRFEAISLLKSELTGISQKKNED